MTEWTTRPEAVEVVEAEYRRLLGYPVGAELSERAGELAEWARGWYQRHGKPWIYTRAAEHLKVEDGAVEIDQAVFHSSRLRTLLQEGKAHSVFVAAVSAGGESEREAQRLWEGGRPDEYFFLETYASAVVENLVQLAGGRLCAWADREGLAILPHASPGYAHWDVAEQGELLRVIRRGAATLPGPLEALESGALAPRKSQLAVFGVTRETGRTVRLTELVPCRECALGSCQFRRAAYARGRAAEPAYSIAERALRRWAAERLVLEEREDGTIHARFRYDGVTCTNLGMPLAFDYEVTLGGRSQGFPIREQRCAPAAGDAGYRSMCRYIADEGGLMAAIEHEKPLEGRPLAVVLEWRRAGLGAGCYCEPASREHKWGLVLETIHYALHHPESPWQGGMRPPAHQPAPQGGKQGSAVFLTMHGEQS